MDNDNADKTNSSWVRLNVGGKVFQTSKQTLKSCPGTLLARLCDEDSQLPSAKDESGAILIDRDPEYFSVILNFLRHGDLVFSANCSLEGVRKEADFFNLPELVELCQIQLNEADLNRAKQAQLCEKQTLLCQKQLDVADSDREKLASICEKLELLCQSQLDEAASSNRKKALRFLKNMVPELSDDEQKLDKLIELGSIENIEVKVRGYSHANASCCKLLSLSLNSDGVNLLNHGITGFTKCDMKLDLFVSALTRAGFAVRNFSNKQQKPTYVMVM